MGAFHSRRWAAVGAGVLLAAGSLSGQKFFGEVAVDIVSIDVVVTERSGGMVLDLGVEDFTVTVDGVAVSPQLVWSPLPEVSGSDTEALLAPEPLTIVLLVDRTFSSQRFRLQALGWLEPFVRDHVAAGGPLLVAAADPLVTILHRIDDPPEALWQVLEAERKVAGSGSSVWQEREYLLRSIERMQPDSQGGLGGPASLGGAAEAESLTSEVRAYGERTAQTAVVHLESVARFVDGLSGLAGRAVVVYVAERLPVRPTEVLEEALNLRMAEVSGRPPMSAARLRSRRPEVDRARVLLERSAAAADLPFLMVDPAVSRSLSAVSAEQRGSATRLSGAAADAGAAFEVASSLAAASGGRVLAANEGLPDQLAATREELEGAYRLTFTPPHEADDEVHRVEVKVTRSGARVVHREHYRLRNPREKVTTAALAALQVGAGENLFGVTVETGEPRDAGGGAVQVPLMLRVPLEGLTLVPQGEEHRGQLLVGIASGDAEGRLEGLHEQPLPLVIPNEQLLTALGQDAGFAVHLGLRPGEHLLGIAVLDEITGRVGALRVPITVEETP